MTLTALFQRGIHKLFILGLVAVLTACGGGSGGKKSSGRTAISSVVASSIAVSSAGLDGQVASSSASTTSSVVSSVITPSSVSSLAMSTASSTLSAVSSAISSSSVSSLAQDTTPNAFSFTAVTGAALSANLTSATITISGINAAAPISISGGQYAIGNGAPTSNAGTIANGQTVTLTLLASATPSTTTQAVLTIGGVTGIFSVTTVLADTTPDAFSFTTVTTGLLNTAVTSNSVTVSGINTAVPISISNGEYSIAGGAYTSAAATVSNGQTLTVKTTSAAGINSTTQAVVTVGGVAGTFSIITVLQNTTPYPMGGAIQGASLNIATVVTTLAGMIPDDIDGVGSSARFNRPNGSVSDGTNLYIADTFNHKIRKIVIATGTVTTLAGTGSLGDVDGIGTAASFNYPYGITRDGTNLYITDSGNNKIRKIVIATGVVTTLAGSGSSGNADGTGAAATFRNPYDITKDDANLYIADTLNHKIRKIVIATGVVTTLAGSGSLGNIDGTGTAASFNYPYGITSDGTNLYIADSGNHTIRKLVIATGVVTTLAGGASGRADGTGTAASFSYPLGITSDGTNLYIADTFNNRIRKLMIATGVVTTLAGEAPGSADGTGTAASFKSPSRITIDGTNLYIADAGNNTIRKIVIATGVVTTLAGSGSSGNADGTGTAATFFKPTGITTDGDNLYIADTWNHKIRKLVIATGVVTTLAGSGSDGYLDGIGTEASFDFPTGITTDGTNLYIADTLNDRIRKLSIATGVVTTLAGGIWGSEDGIGTAASFFRPAGITTDGTNLYITDGNNTIRKIVIATGVVTTLAGSGSSGNADGTGAAASFKNPNGITSDGVNLYITDYGNNTIRKIVIATGVVTTLAGNGSFGKADGTGAAASFVYPYGITSDGANLYIADTGNDIIRKIVIATGVVTTLAGRSPGNVDGTGTAASFYRPYGIISNGFELFVTDTENNTIRKIH